MPTHRQNAPLHLLGRNKLNVSPYDGRLREVADVPVAGSQETFQIESGNGADISISNIPRIASVQTKSGASVPFALFAYINEDPTADVGLFSVQAASKTETIAAVAKTGPVGGLVPRGKLIAGHAGTSRDLNWTILPGAMSKMPYIGSSGTFGVFAVPKYFDWITVGSTRRYGIWVQNTGGGFHFVFLSSYTWNNQGPQLPGWAFGALAQSGAAEYVVLLDTFDRSRYSRVSAHFGNAASASTVENQPALIFYGNLRPGAANATRTRVPVGFNATSVMLVGGGNITKRLVMSQFPDPATYDPANVDPEIGPQPSNVLLPLSAYGEGYIEVFSPDDNSALTKDIPFEIHYYLGA